jgi:hypothetical protein
MSIGLVGVVVGKPSADQLSNVPTEQNLTASPDFELCSFVGAG